MQKKVIYIDDFYQLFESVRILSAGKKEPYAFITSADVCEYACYHFITDELMDIGKISIDTHDEKNAYIVLVDDKSVSVSPIMTDKNALLKKASGIYIDIDITKQSIVDACNKAGKKVVLFTLDEDYITKDEEEIKDNVKITRHNNGGMKGFSMSYNTDNRFSSFSFYSSDEKIVNSMINKVQAIIGKK